MESALVLAAAGGSERPERFEKFGRYLLLDRIATGGMAEVFRAVIHGVEGFQRTFIVKRILAHKASSPDFIRMFCDEARISALLHHPNIAQVYDFGHFSGSYFLAMEYLPGKDLASLARALRAANASVPSGLAAYVTREAALGLHYAHTLRGPNGDGLGIVHRDVSPSNIMVLFAGGVKLLDFGIAKTAAAVAADAGIIKGKFAYLAPEQARGEEVDGRADVFALGVTLWEMLVGRRLFAGKDDLETLRNVMERPVPPPSSLRPQIPAALDRIALRALERQREQRYATAEELARDCDAVLETLRSDGLTLRAFLSELFAQESTSLSLTGPALPEELFAEPTPPPPPAARHDRLPALPDPIAPWVVMRATLPRRWRGSRILSLGGAVAAAGLLIALGVAREGRSRAPAGAFTKASPAAAPSLAALPPLVVLLPPADPTGASAPPAGEAKTVPAPRAARVKPVRRGRAHPRAVPPPEFPLDLTLNPF
jgi:serine/threonine-protein kinase